MDNAISTTTPDGIRALERFMAVLTIGPGALLLVIALLCLTFSLVLCVLIIGVTLYLALLYAWREAVVKEWAAVGGLLKKIGAWLETVDDAA